MPDEAGGKAQLVELHDHAGAHGGAAASRAHGLLATTVARRGVENREEQGEGNGGDDLVPEGPAGERKQGLDQIPPGLVMPAAL